MISSYASVCTIKLLAILCQKSGVLSTIQIASQLSKKKIKEPYLRLVSFFLLLFIDNISQDLEPKDIQSDIFMVCRLIRRGVFNDVKTGKTKLEYPLRRPFGVGVLKLDHAKLLEQRLESQILLFQSSEQNFAQLHESAFISTSTCNFLSAYPADWRS